MHDIKAIRDDTAAFVRGLTRRGIGDAQIIADNLLQMDKALRELLARLQNSQARRNEASKLIGQAKAKKDEAGAAALMAEVAGLKDSIQQGEAEQRAAGIKAARGAGGDSQYSRRWRAGRRGRKRQCAGDEPRLRHAAWDQRAQTAFRDRRGAGPDGFRTRRQGVGRAVCVSERTIWRSWSARWARSCWIRIRKSSVTPKSRRRCW